jgi:uncharacterized protein (DUF1501 family)
MNDPLSRELSRRKFIGACCAAVSATGMLSALAQLRLLGALAEPSNTPLAGTADVPDYRALVCLFLAGGNDANNLIIPNDSSGYATYAAGRTTLALPQTGLLGINPATTDGRAWALHPAMSGFKQLFDSGKGALLANVGTLVVPTNKTQYNAKSVPLPLQLFSHNDQQVEWQSSVPEKAFTTGWGGRLADLTNAFNTNNSISMSISLAGQNSFQVGKQVVQYSVGTNGAIALSGSSTSATSVAGLRTKAQADILNSPNNNLFETAFAGMTTNAINDSALLAGVLNGSPALATTFPTSNLGQQMRMIARLIAVRNQLGLKRQIFFARIGGWDLHDSQLSSADPLTGAHANLLTDVANSLKAFYDATVELGVAEKVTTFTASDFGRTLRSNGDGSDHGWGSHHLVVGGAVRGGDIYGKMPDLTVNGPDDTGSGRWIPTTSVDEYSATLARWFGVSDSDLPLVLPNIGRFARPDLGFMA